ncbi:MAG: UbiA family prenyltransferase [Pirellulales bacterium]
MRAYLELLRLPNVFTAMADILLGFLFTHERLEPWPQFALLLGASGLLYLGGMVLNDYFDRQQDARERPQRPIPSGRIRAGTAQRLGLGMLAGGVALGCGAAVAAGTWLPAIVAVLLAACVLAYDSGLKRTPGGPLAMGACRTLNVLLGMSVAIEPWQPVHWVVAGGVGLYIVGVTLFARREAAVSGRVQLMAGTLILVAGIALLSSAPRWVTGNEWPPVAAPPRWYVFWGLIGLLIAWRCLRAVIEPRPANVQAAVRNCIFALVILDAGAVLAVQDRMWALVILTLLIPTMFLGRWIYST